MPREWLYLEPHGPFYTSAGRADLGPGVQHGAGGVYPGWYRGANTGIGPGPVYRARASIYEATAMSPLRYNMVPESIILVWSQNGKRGYFMENW